MLQGTDFREVGWNLGGLWNDKRSIDWANAAYFGGIQREGLLLATTASLGAVGPSPTVGLTRACDVRNGSWLRRAPIVRFALTSGINGPPLSMEGGEGGGGVGLTSFSLSGLIGHP